MSKNVLVKANEGSGWFNVVFEEDGRITQWKPVEENEEKEVNEE